VVLPLLLTRPAAASARFAALWRARMGADAPVTVAPVVAVRALPFAPPPPGTDLILTSENALLAVGPADPPGRRAWCVGARTAAAARAAGFDPVSADGAADDLVALILARGARGPFLHARGAEARGEVAARLSAVGLPAAEAVVYAQQDVALTDAARALLLRPGAVLVPLFSPNSAVRLAAELARLPAPPAASLRLAALSPAVAAAWTGPAPERLAIAARPEASAMLDALAGLDAAGPPP
jgi:uroporphyrinogen-III synthase